MSHQTSGTILHSLLDAFDPNNEHYTGVRNHFSANKLQRIDFLRSQSDDFHFGFEDRLFIAWALGKVVMSAENPD